MIQIPNRRFQQAMHPWHRDIWGRYDRHEAQFFVQRWHRRSLKTTGNLNLFIRECCRFEHLIATIVFPHLKEAKKAVWYDPKMLKSYLPPQEVMGWKMNHSELHVQFANDSLLRVEGADTPDSIRGEDTDLLDLSEYAMMKQEVWTEVYLPILSKNPRSDFERCAFFDFTPKGDNHAKDLWENAIGDGWYRSMLTAEKSGIITPQALERYRKNVPPAVYDQEMMCSFITEEERVLITTAMLDELRKRGALKRDYVRRGLSCDPSLGGDECVIYVWENTRIIDELFLHERDGMKIAGHIVALVHRHNLAHGFIEGDQMGKVVHSRVRELMPKFRLLIYNMNGDAIDKERFLNQRAEAHFTVAEEMRDLEIDYPVDRELRRQLTNIHFDVTSSRGKLKIEDGNSIRKNLGRSGDRASAFIQWLYNRTKVPTEDKLDRPRLRSERNRSAMGA